MNRRNHETIFPSDPPAPEQLHRLARIATSSSADRQRLKRPHKSSSRARIFIDEVDTYLTNENDDLTLSRHRMSGRVGVKAREASETVVRTWTLKLFDTYWVVQGDGKSLAERTLYEFEWSRAKVEMARRSFRLVTNEETSDRDVSGDILRMLDFGISEDEMALLNARLELEKITSDDCDRLIREATIYYESLREPDAVKNT